MPKSLRALVLVVAAAMAAGGCRRPASPAPPPPAANPPAAHAAPLSDDLGRPWTGALPAKRVISLAPSITEILCAIGARSRLVGIDDYSHYPPEVEKIQRVGQFLSPSAERVVALRPDVVLLSSETITPGAVAEFQSHLGVPVFVLCPHRLADVPRNVRLIGRLLGLESGGERVAGNLEQRLTAIEKKVAGQPRPTVFFEVFHQPLQAVGPNTVLNDLIRVAGGRNVAESQSQRFPLFSLEALIAADPEAYVVTTDHGAVAVSDPAKRPGFSALRAVRAGRVVRIPGDLILQPTPRLVEGTEMLARALHPESFR